jgi:serine/threonine protein phosphatase PrpC
MGASILPVTVHNGKVLLLFGKERNIDSNPGWSDFGGGTDKGETFMETAVREGGEEMTGFLGSSSDIRQLLKKYGVVPTPYIAKHTISEKDRYVVMCSDGVWDALDEAKVFELSLKCSNSDELSDLIVKRAVEIGSRDNISCIVIKVN